ncbi:MAG: Lrp/AsnC family transcriptional regulator [Phycisphaerales bacterium]|nr:Lrp/AsnC family transcriptional regulator [Phycisphaerales bacterium]
MAHDSMFTIPHMADIVTCPMDIDDPINRRILTVAEDQLMGFYRHPFEEISRRCRVAEEIVHQRLKAMLQAGVVRRIRQTLQAGNLADGALVAWKISEDHLQNAYDWLAAMIHSPGMW